MDVLARLPPLLLAHLRVVAGRDHSVTPVDDWGQLGECVRTHRVDIAVLDPRDGDTLRIAEVEALVMRYPSLPIVLYTTLTAAAVQATVELAGFGVRHVVLRGFDDEPRTFRGLLDRVPAYAMSDEVLAALSPKLVALPAALVRAIERLFRSPRAFHDVDDLAVAAGMTRRSLDRWLDRAALAPAKLLVVGARMLRAYHYMRDPGYRLEDVAAKLGYSTTRLFARQMRLATGLMPSAVRRNVGPTAFAAQLAERLGRRGCVSLAGDTLAPDTPEFDETGEDMLEELHDDGEVASPDAHTGR
ncbi:MAG: AraC family transcriptional regulator [Gemmatimonadaceae bacterium]